MESAANFRRSTSIGPLDKLRIAQKSAGDLEGKVIAGDVFGEEQDFIQSAYRLDRFVTFMMNEVVEITGRKLLLYESAEDEVINDMLGNFSVSSEEVTEQGSYRGFFVKRQRIYLEEQERVVVLPRVVCGLMTGMVTAFDKVHNNVITQEMSYFLAADSAIEPIDPANAHSLEDLKTNRLIEEIDDIIYAQGSMDDMSYTSNLKRLGELFRFVCRRQDLESSRLIKQQLSYLNSTQYVRGCRLLTNTVICEAEDGEAGYLDRDTLYEVEGEMFCVSEGVHFRLEGAYIPKIPQLFVTGTIVGDRDKTPVAVPVNYLQEARLPKGPVVLSKE